MVRQTTLQAFETIKPALSNLQYTVYSAIRSSSTGLTDNEISSICQMNSSTARPRRIELLRLGYIQEAGVKKQPNGRSSTVWISLR